MRRVLFIAPWEYDTVHNARSGNLLRQFASAGEETTLLCQTTHTSYAWRDILRHSLWCRTRVTRGDATTTLTIDPFLNYTPGLRDNCFQQTGTARTKRLRRLFVRAMAPLGLLKDLSCLLSLWFCGWMKLTGSYDWCLGFGPRGALVGWLLKKVGKVRLLVYEDQDYAPGFTGGYVRRWYTSVLERFLVHRADIVISVGYRLACLRRSQTGKVPYVVHNGATRRLFEPAQRKTTHPPTLVFVGNLSPWDGLELSIEALHRMRHTLAHLRLLVVADGSPAYTEGLHRLVAQKGLSHVVQFMGPRQHDELPDVFRQADIGLAHFRPVPYRVFSCPLKVFEYMASGLPVIGTVDTEAGELIQRYDCGVAIPYRIAALVQAIGTLVSDREGYERYRSNAIKHSRQFDWQVLFKREHTLIARHDSSRFGATATDQ